MNRTLSPMDRLPKALCGLLAVLLFAGPVCLAANEAPKYLNPDDFDLKALLGDPPADDSAEHRAEIDRMLDYQVRRTAADEKRCRDEEQVTAFVFSDVLGYWLNAKDLPATATLMQQVYLDTKAVSGGAKKIWNRTRPPLAEPRIKPCVALEHTGSYPSGHAARGVAWATVLAELFPEYREQLIARGRLVGEDRVIGGMHYPSDVAAGQKLGAAVAAKLLKNPDFRAALQQAKEECRRAASK